METDREAPVQKKKLNPRIFLWASCPYFWRVEVLKEKLKKGSLAEGEIFWYIFLFIVASGIFFFPVEKMSYFEVVNDVVLWVLSLLGMVYLFYCNGGTKGKNFLERYFALGLPITIRWVVFLLLPFLVMYIVTYGAMLTITGVNNVWITAWGFIFFFASLFLCYLWIFGEHIKDIALNRSVNKKRGLFAFLFMSLVFCGIISYAVFPRGLDYARDIQIGQSDSQMIDREDIQVSDNKQEEEVEVDDVVYRYSDSGCRLGVIEKNQYNGKEINMDFRRHCSDGTRLSINPTTCDFDSCDVLPTKKMNLSKWEEYKNIKYGFSIRYPDGWSVKEKSIGPGDFNISFSNKDCGEHCGMVRDECSQQSCWNDYHEFNVSIIEKSEKSQEIEYQEEMAYEEKKASKKELFFLPGGKNFYLYELSEVNEKNYEYTIDIGNMPMMYAYVYAEKYKMHLYTWGNAYNGEQGFYAGEYLKEALKTLEFGTSER